MQKFRIKFKKENVYMSGQGEVVRHIQPVRITIGSHSWVVENVSTKYSKNDNNWLQKYPLSFASLINNGRRKR